ncbi:MAG: hypothetical protein GX657_13580 [Chloroflexi bacterium]|nr:hypothetical protein [Chloroflexota bacterium]
MAMKRTLSVRGTLAEGDLLLAALAGVLVLLWGLVGMGALATWTSPPDRLATEAVPLEAYGLPGVEVRLLYPAALPAPGEKALLTVLARAGAPSEARPFTLAFTLPDEAAGFVDAAGWPTSGRLTVTPGAPEAAPYSLWLARTSTAAGGGLLRGRRIPVEVSLVTQEGAARVVGLSFTVGVPARLPRAARGLLRGAAAALWRPLTLATVLAAALWGAAQALRRRRERERAESEALYQSLVEQVQGERWAEARRSLDALGAQASAYRDAPLLERRVREEEMALWRRERNYRRGTEAYRQREWRAAARAFDALERDDPYARDVPYLRRTAALYADLASRDRSRRIAAARALGEVGDLADWSPLVQALADPCEAVADAAEQAFQRSGPAAYEALLGGLRSPHEAVAARSERLLRGFGQPIRERLLAALRADDPALTARVAGLLAALGARRELAEALLWAEDAHLPGLAAALANEGVAAAGVLVDVLRTAPAERVGVVLAAIGALKARADVSRPLEEALRATRAREERERLERAVALAAAPYAGPVEWSPAPAAAPAGPPGADAAPAADGSLAAEAGAGNGAPPERGRRMRFFDRTTG